MKIAVMQPYFLPYLGYFQLIQGVDHFIVYDNIQYTKKGWINRNRFLLNGKDTLFSVPLHKGPELADIRDRQLDPDFKKSKLLNQFQEAYRQAPHVKEVFPLVEAIVLEEEMNLFRFIYHSIKRICAYLSIDTEILISSELPIDHSLKGSEKVMAFCKFLGADMYINAIGGQELYTKENFSAAGIELKFLKTKFSVYQQFHHEFVPALSIIDVMMFNSKDKIKEYLTKDYDLI